MSVTLNLIPTTRLTARRRRTVLRRWLFGGGALAAVLIAMTVVAQLRWGGEPADLASTLDDAARRTSDTRSQLARMREELSAIERRLDANRAVTHQPNYAVLMALMARSLDDQLVLRSCAFEPMPVDSDGPAPVRRTSDADDHAQRPAGFPITASGLAVNQRAVSAYLLRLEQMGLFHRVRLINTRREPTPFGSDPAIAFEIECYLATGDRPDASAPADEGGRP